MMPSCDQIGVPIHFHSSTTSGSASLMSLLIPELMRRVLAVDVLECPRCSGPMRIVAAIHLPEAIREILDCLGLPSRAPPIARAATEDADEPEFFWARGTSRRAERESCAQVPRQ